MPKAIAMAKEPATRASVQPISNGSSPERVSARMVAPTSSGPGSSRECSSAAAMAQAAIRATSEVTRCNASVSARGRLIVEALVKLLRRAYQLRAADTRECAEQRAGVGGFRGERPPRYPLPCPISVGLERRIIRGIHQWAERVPFLVG